MVVFHDFSGMGCQKEPFRRWYPPPPKVRRTFSPVPYVILTIIVVMIITLAIGVRRMERRLDKKIEKLREEVDKEMVQIQPKVRVPCVIKLTKNEGTTSEQRKHLEVPHISGTDYWEFTEAARVEVGDKVFVKSGDDNVVDKKGKVTQVTPTTKEGWVRVTIVMEGR